MVGQTSLRMKKYRRPLPPGQRLLLLVLICGLCCALTIWVFQARPNGAQKVLVQPGIAVTSPNTNSGFGAAVPPFRLTDELTALKQQLTAQIKQPNLHAGIFAVEPDTGKFIDIDSRRAYSAASMIKLPVFVALCRALDAKEISLDQELTMRPDLIGGGSGWLQWRKPGIKMSVKDTAELMMIISDNTATNMIIDLLGGKDKLNASFSEWGLGVTKINNWLPDLPGTNTTSPYDLAFVLGKVDAGDLVSPQSRAWLLNTLERNKIRTLLPMGVPPGTKIADKTGDIGPLVGDIGIITTKNGQRYIASVSVERPWNDRRANALIRQVSKGIYVGITGDAAGVKGLNEARPAKQSRHSGRRRHGRRHR